MDSLTTPPSSEGVNWLVPNEPISISPAQIKEFVQAVGGENAHLLAGPTLQN